MSRDEIDHSEYEENSGKNDESGSRTHSRDRNECRHEGTDDAADSIERAECTDGLTAVIEAVRNNENANGYASYASVVGQKGIRAVSVDGVECTEENIKNGSYAVKRPFNFITKESAKLSAPAQAFYDFMISPDAAELIKKAGAVPFSK